MEIDKKLYSDIKDYCKMNGLKVGEYVNSLLRKAFTKDKFGESPFQTESAQNRRRLENKAMDSIERMEKEGNAVSLTPKQASEADMNISEALVKPSDTENTIEKKPKRRRLN